jgi:hypothetical protein
VAVKRNLTIQLDDDVIVAAKVLAARRGTSISGLVAHEITRLTAAAERYERARASALARMAEGGETRAPADPPIDRGWTRDEIYAERTDRWPRS